MTTSTTIAHVFRVSGTNRQVGALGVHEPFEIEVEATSSIRATEVARARRCIAGFEHVHIAETEWIAFADTCGGCGFSTGHHPDRPEGWPTVLERIRDARIPLSHLPDTLLGEQVALRSAGKLADARLIDSARILAEIAVENLDLIAEMWAQAFPVLPDPDSPF